MRYGDWWLLISGKATAPVVRVWRTNAHNLEIATPTPPPSRAVPRLRRMPEDYREFGIRLEVTGPVATVTLCRPEARNAQTPRMWAALAEIGEEMPPDVRVVVVRGEGQSFSAGLDLAMFRPEGIPGDLSFGQMLAHPDGEVDEMIAGFQEAFSWWRRPSLVSVAVVQGHAVGAGFQLSLACDLRVLADDAQLCMRETGLGLVPDLGGTQPLVEQLGYSRALEICVTGRWVSAAEAKELGLATIVVPRAELDSTTADLVSALLAAPADAVTATKALLRSATRRGYDEQLAAERAAQVKRLRALRLFEGSDRPG
jgi:enoyl-CoA hydratase/carnithine racemase